MRVDKAVANNQVLFSHHQLALFVCQCLAEASNPNANFKERIVNSNVILMYLTLETAYAWSGTGIDFQGGGESEEDGEGGGSEEELSMIGTAQEVTDVAWSMVESLPVREPSLEVDRPDIGAMQDAIDVLERQLRVSEVLHKYGVHIPLAALKAATDAVEAPSKGWGRHVQDEWVQWVEKFRLAPMSAEAEKIRKTQGSPALLPCVIVQRICAAVCEDLASTGGEEEWSDRTDDLKVIVRNLPLAACVGDSDPSAATELNISRWAMAHALDAVLTTPGSGRENVTDGLEKHCRDAAVKTLLEKINNIDQGGGSDEEGEEEEGGSEGASGTVGQVEVGALEATDGDAVQAGEDEAAAEAEEAQEEAQEEDQLVDDPTIPSAPSVGSAPVGQAVVSGSEMAEENVLSTARKEMDKAHGPSSPHLQAAADCIGSLSWSSAELEVERRLLRAAGMLVSLGCTHSWPVPHHTQPHAHVHGQSQPHGVVRSRFPLRELDASARLELLRAVLAQCPGAYCRRSSEDGLSVLSHAGDDK